MHEQNACTEYVIMKGASSYFLWSLAIIHCSIMVLPLSRSETLSGTQKLLPALQGWLGFLSDLCWNKRGWRIKKSRRAFDVYLIATLKESWVDGQDVLSSQVLWSALGYLSLFKLSGNLGHLQTLEHESNADKSLQFSERSHVCCKDESRKETPGASAPVKLCFWRRQGCHYKSSVETEFPRKRCGWSAFAALAERNAG